MKILRPHQAKAVEKVWDSLCESPQNKPLCVVPVGGGKSLIMASLIEKTREYSPRAKILCLSHVAELAKQVAEEIEELLPDLTYGFYSAKLGEKNVKEDITVATIQSIFKKAKLFFGGFDLCLCDECHLISHKDESMYRKLFSDLLLKNPYMRIVGLTGTDFRSMKNKLTEDENALFTNVAYQIPMMQLIKDGYLCEAITPEFGVKTRLSTEGVAIRGGDYVESQLQEAVDKHELTEDCVREILLHGVDRRKGIVFTSGVRHAQHVYEEFLKQGELSVAVVTGSTPTEERNAIVERYKYGDLKYLINVAVFTTGFNCPEIDLMAIMRPMRSPVLYTQIMGRGMRIADGKENCLVLDFGGVIEELGPIDTLDMRIGKKKKASDKTHDAPMKICPKCESVNFAGVRFCCCCEFEFPPSERETLSDSASTAAILSNQTKKKVKRVKVTMFNYTKHTAKGSNTPVMKVTYIDDTYKSYNEFLCFEHTGAPSHIATKWFKSRFPLELVPKTIDEALKYKYPKPTEIDIVKRDKYYTVLKSYFEEQR